MHVTVDKVGRIVIPKALRIALGIHPDTELEVLTDGGGLRLEPVSGSERLLDEADGLPLLTAVGDSVLTDIDIQRLRDDVQR